MSKEDRQSSGAAVRFPRLEDEDAAVLAYKDRHFNRDATQRNAHMSRMALGLYYYLSRQWVDLDREILTDGVRGFAMREVVAEGDVEYPRPITNYIARAVSVEFSSLGKRELTANVIPTSNDGRIKSAAAKAKEILEYRLKVNGWAKLRELVTLDTIVFGTGILKSFWDETVIQTTRVPVLTAKSCPGCGKRFASNRVSRGVAIGSGMLHMDSAKDLSAELDPMDEEPIELGGCPFCSAPTSFEDYAPSDPEVLSGKDVFGRPLGQDAPKGNTAIEVVSPFDFFPENSGIGYDVDRMRIWGQATVRSLDWVEERHPEWIDRLTPDDPAMLIKYHPLVGTWDVMGRFNSALDSCVFDNHVMVYDLYSEPTMRNPKGAFFRVVGEEVLKRTALIREIDAGELGTLSAPIARFNSARYRPRRGEFWGQGLVDDLISPQNRLNGIDAQMIEARERLGSPNLLVPEEVYLSGPEWFEGYGSGKVMKYQISPLNPQAKPEVFSPMTVPPGSFEERSATVQDMKEVVGPADVELGEAPRNISTTSGLQLLGEAAERKRGPVERDLTSMYEGTWEHQLQMLWAFRSEEDSYELETKEGVWARKQFDRTTLAEQTKVKVEKQAYIDKGIYIKEASREAQADGLYRLDSQAAIKRILEIRGLPTDVNEDLNRQVDRATQQWIDFRDEGILPVIDKTLDDPLIHYQVLGEHLLSEEGTEIAKVAGWPELLKLIAGWEDQLVTMEQTDMAVRAFYGGRLPQAQADEIYAQGMIAHKAALDAHQAAVQAQAQSISSSAMLGEPAVPPQPIPPPQQPPPPVFLPAQIEARVYMAWLQMMTVNMPQPEVPEEIAGLEPPLQPPELSQEAQQFLQFRAVYEGYRLLSEQKAMGAALGAAPGMVPPPGAGNGVQQAPNPPTPPMAPGVGGQRVQGQ